MPLPHIAMLGVVALASPQDPVAAVVFRSGEDGYHTFRIPAVVRCLDGTLLAFAEGRKESAGDSGDIDLVMRSSSDGGRSWSAMDVIHDADNGVAGNPCPVVDRDSGDVVLLLVLQPGGCHESDIRAGRKGSRTPMVMRSTDQGRTWAEPRSLPSCRHEDWRWYATGPCHAIQLEHGEHRGRMVAPANHSDSEGPGNDRFGAHLLLSDDGGRTWRIGAVDASHRGDDIVNPSETTVAELRDGTILANTRDHHGSSEGTRAVTRSRDGGESFEKPFAAEPTLVGPVCQGSMLRTGDGLWFAGPSDPKGRRRLAIRRSDDGGATWTEHTVLHAGGAAYADLVALDREAIGCLFEADGYRSIHFKVFTSKR